MSTEETAPEGQGLPLAKPVAAEPAATPNPADAPAIFVEGLCYAYKRNRVLHNVDFTVARKSIHGFVGPNGAGKTTTLKVLSTLLRPERGTVRIFGQDAVKEYKEVRARMGFMPDHFSMYRQMTVYEYLDFFAAAYGLTAGRRKGLIEDVLTLTDMMVRKDDLIKGLSRGMQQRVSLARVLVHDPELLLLDEPASGLDPRARIELMEILRELRRMGKTIFISSHILSELAALCDSFTIIDRGIVKYTGAKRGLLFRDGPRRSYVLTLQHPHPPVEELLGKLEGIESVVKLDDGEFRVIVNADLVRPNAVLRAMIAAEAQVVHFHEDTSELNQAFMDLTEPGVSA
jgi:ABC-2 type transport system ATP-binding protein